MLEQLKESRPLPHQIRVDNGPELFSAKTVAWCEEHDVHLHPIEPGKPTHNAYVERFNRSFRHEVQGKKLLKFSDDQRRRLALKAKRLGFSRLKEESV